MFRLTLCVLIASASVTSALTPLQGDPSQPTGSISGRVVDEDVGTPLADVAVSLADKTATTTDSNGRYVLKGLRNGLYQVFVDAKYIASLAVPPANVSVVGGRPVTGVDFRVRLRGEIRGSVLDDAGVPVNRAKVLAVIAEYARLGATSDTEIAVGGLSYRSVASAYTDDRGEYALPGVPAGRAYRILAYVPRHYDSAQPDSPRDIPSRRLTRVATYYPNAETYEAGVPVKVSSLQRLENIGITMRRASSYCIDGTLLTGGVTIPMEFAIEEEEVHRIQTFNILSGGDRVAGRTGMHGRFRVCDLYNGRFGLTATDSFGRVPARSRWQGTTVFEITDSDARGIVLDAVAPVTFNAELVPDAGPGVGTQLALGVRTVPSSLALPGARSASGPFAFSLIQPIYYSLTVSRLAPGQYVRDIVDVTSNRSVMHQYIVPEPGQAISVRVAIGLDGGTVTATVTAATGEPLTHGSLFVLPATAQSEVEVAAGLTVASISPTGVATTGALRPGDYVAFASTHSLPGFVLLPSMRQVVDKTPEAIGALMKMRGLGRRIVVPPNGSVRISLKPIQ